MAKRTIEGRFQKKRGDTRIGTIEKKYNVDFGVRSDKKLENYLKDEKVCLPWQKFSRELAKENA